MEVIQQLRGTNFTKFEWTDILHTLFTFFTSLNFLLTTYLPLLVQVVIECPPWPRLVVVAGQGSTQSLDNTRFSFLFTHNLKMLLSLSPFFSPNTTSLPACSHCHKTNKRKSGLKSRPK